MKVIANSNEKLPKVLMTTGAVTHPRYKDDRIGRIANKDHIYGAIVVEIEDDDFYHYRQIQATQKGEFVDLGVRYHEKGVVTTAKLEAIVFGDWHVGDTDERVRAANYEMIQTLRPKRVLLHDFFNGHSVNHHVQNNIVELSREYDLGRLSLEVELQQCAEELKSLSRAVGKNTEIVIVSSNHNEFLDRYLNEGRFVKDAINLEIACKILPRYKQEGNAFRAGLELVAGSLPQNLIFLDRDEDYKVQGWQLGNHGDKGANGARSFSMDSKEFAYGKSITGHSHVPEIKRNTYVVGTSTKQRLNYNVGPSGWMQTHALLWNTGKVQLVNVINGKWNNYQNLP